ncbi:MAG: DinB family protein [bacterium]|nr:DinB family protein [bacterium]
MIKEIINSYSLCLDYARRLVSDLTEDQMVAQPTNLPNHPAWTIGHIIYSAQMIGGEIGIQPWLTPDWVELFRTGSIPKSDISIYPEKKILLDALNDAENRINQRLFEITESDLAQPLPDERYRIIFPTTGHAVLHILTVHIAHHIGQMVAWRRAMQLPPFIHKSNS